MTPPILLIAGPTASGKTALALRAARALGGEIVNADALQLYADLRVLSARPSDEEHGRRVPHHLFGVADGADGWSVGRWLRAASPLLADIRARGRTPVVVGGTGLYFKALTEGLADVPPTPAAVRQSVTAMYDALGEARFRELLASADPDAARRIEAGDRMRLSAAPWRCSRPPAAPSPPGRPTRRRRWRLTTGVRWRSRPTAPTSTPAVTRGSTPCWRRGRWTRSGPCWPRAWMRICP
jgi:DNA polymerase III delta prime subunit